MKEINDVDYNPINHIHRLHKLVLNSFTKKLHHYNVFAVTGQGSVTLKIFAPNRAIAIAEAALTLYEKFNVMPFSVSVQADI